MVVCRSASACVLITGCMIAIGGSTTTGAEAPDQPTGVVNLTLHAEHDQDWLEPAIWQVSAREFVAMSAGIVASRLDETDERRRFTVGQITWDVEAGRLAVREDNDDPGMLIAVDLADDERLVVVIAEGQMEAVGEGQVQVRLKGHVAQPASVVDLLGAGEVELQASIELGERTIDLTIAAPKLDASVRFVRVDERELEFQLRELESRPPAEESPRFRLPEPDT